MHAGEHPVLRVQDAVPRPAACMQPLDGPTTSRAGPALQAHKFNHARPSQVRDADDAFSGALSKSDWLYCAN